MKNINHTESRN